MGYHRHPEQITNSCTNQLQSNVSPDHPVCERLVPKTFPGKTHKVRIIGTIEVAVVVVVFLAASRVANVALRELRVVVLVLVLLLLRLLLVKTKPLGLGSFIYRIRISLNTKHLYTSSH